MSGHAYFILRVWLPTERRYWWHELYSRRDWWGLIPGTRWQIWAVDDDGGMLVWPAPAGAEDVAKRLLQNAARSRVPLSRSYRQKCRRRMRRLIRYQVGEQRETDDWAKVVGEAAAYLLQHTKDGVLQASNVEDTPFMRRHQRIAAKESAAKHRVRLKC
jgi:hypothetical protein